MLESLLLVLFFDGVVELFLLSPLNPLQEFSPVLLHHYDPTLVIIFVSSPAVCSVRNLVLLLLLLAPRPPFPPLLPLPLPLPSSPSFLNLLSLLLFLLLY